MSDPAGDRDADPSHRPTGPSRDTTPPAAGSAASPAEPVLSALERALSSLAYLLTRSRAHERQATLAGVTSGRSDLYLLMALDHSGGVSRVGDLAVHLMVEPSHVTRQIDRMQALHLVTRTRDAADGRAREVAITPHGSAVLSSLREANRAGLRKALEGVDEDDLAAAARVLSRLAEKYAPHATRPLPPPSEQPGPGSATPPPQSPSSPYSG